VVEVVAGGWEVEVVAKGAIVVVGALVAAVAAEVELEGGASTGSSKQEDPFNSPRERTRSKTAVLRMADTDHGENGNPRRGLMAGGSWGLVGWFHQSEYTRRLAWSEVINLNPTPLAGGDVNRFTQGPVCCWEA